MRALLMHRECNFDLHAPPTRTGDDVVEDLALATLWRGMANDDPFLFDVARVALLSGFANDADTIRYRQEALADCLRTPAVVRALYALAVEALEVKRRHYVGYLARHPSSVLYGSVDCLQALARLLARLRELADDHGARFASPAFTALFDMLKRELGDEYIAAVEHRLAELRFRGGVLLSAGLGPGNAGTAYALRQPLDRRPSWIGRLLGRGAPAYTFRIDPRDEAGARTVSAIRGRGLDGVANAVAQATDHIVGFFQMLRTELGFYVGCLNLRDRLDALGAAICIPEPAAAGTRRLHVEALYDVSLALTMARPAVGNGLEADGKSCVMITGANQGGKSTFLRSVGLAQLMMHCGMFVGARSFSAELCMGLYTHYKREEDAAMRKGKLDEELSRLSDIAGTIRPGAMLLCNESFAATNEREGSEIARQVVHAFLEKGIKVFFVTHLYELAHGLCIENRRDTLFLRAERRDDGTRTFRIVPGEPLSTSYGEDVYRAVFGGPTEARPRT